MKAYELLSAERNWTKGAYARMANNKPCAINSPTAKKWCVIGAIKHCYPDLDERRKAKRMLQKTVQSPTFWNDDPMTAHSEVVCLLEKLDI